MLMVVGPYPPPVHGASRMASLVVAEAERRGAAVVVVSTSAEGRFYHVKRLVAHLRALGKVLRADPRKTHLYQTGAGGAALYYQAAISLVARLKGIPQSFHHHSFAYLNAKSRAMRCLVAAAGADTVHIVLCARMKTLLHSQYACRRVMVASNALFLGPPRLFDRNVAEDFVVGHFGNLSVEKGLDVVLETVSLLRARGVGVRLLLGGPAADDATRGRIESFLDGSGGLDRWVGRVHPDDVGNVLREMDCFLFPSRYRNEAAPLVVFEALRGGVPVLSSGVGCLDEMLHDRRWLRESSSVAMAEGVQELMSQSNRTELALGKYRAQQEVGSLDEFFSLVSVS